MRAAPDRRRTLAADRGRKVMPRGRLCAPLTCCMGVSGRLTYSQDSAEDIDAARLLHHAGASDGPGLVADAARGSRGDHPCRQARLSRRLHGRAPDRRLRERHQQHDVPGDADPRHQADQARHRHHQSRPNASGGDRGQRRDVRSSGARPLHYGYYRRRADVGLRSHRHPRSRPQQDLRRGDRRDLGRLGAQSALRHRFPRQPI